VYASEKDAASGAPEAGVSCLKRGEACLALSGACGAEKQIGTVGKKGQAMDGTAVQMCNGGKGRYVCCWPGHGMVMQVSMLVGFSGEKARQW
jgi:hypothetical protein